MAIKVFISYSHKDEYYREELEKHLSTLKRNGLIDTWSDRKIIVGQEWNKEIRSELENAQLILFLVSSDFLASDYCYDIEVQKAMEMQMLGEAVVAPIILRQCDWNGTLFSQLQALPSGAKPIKNWSDTDSAFFDVVTGLRKLLEQQDNIKKKDYLELVIQSGDALEAQSDIIALKFAQAFHGLDREVASLLMKKSGYRESEIRVLENDYKFLLTKGAIKTPYVLFVGVCELFEFKYNEVKAFSYEVLNILSRQSVNIENLVMTIHGVGYGLDELESFRSQLIGLRDAVNAGLTPKNLKRITIIDKSVKRVERLNQYLNDSGERLGYSNNSDNTWGLKLSYRLLPSRISKTSFKPNYSNENNRESIFVAIPFKKEFDDVYYLGIQSAAHENNLLCERIDLETFTGDVLKQVLLKIENAKIVIAEITGANPNVYLEIGYAWGHKKPTILVIKSSDDLKFDIQGQKCLTYERIIDLKSNLTNEIKKLNSEADS